MNTPLTCLLVGAGIRGRQCVEHAVAVDPQFQPVAVAEPDSGRRNEFGDRYGIAANRRYDSWQTAAQAGKIADCVINATLDDAHRDSAVALLDRGYAMLLEKPIARTEQEMQDILAAARRNGTPVLVSHQLRYSPFYCAIKQILESGRLGVVKQIRMVENVAWHHFVTGYVRGPFRNTRSAAPFILAKSCHDTDILAWLLAGNPPQRVSAFGSLTHFTAANAPAGATEFCYGGCPHLNTCIYSAENLYVSGNIRRSRALGDFHGSDDDARARLKTSPWGRCVWHCDNDITDQIAVQVEFADGAIGTLASHGFATRPSREIVIHGTQGELVGDLEDNQLTVRIPQPPGGRYATEVIDTRSDTGDENDGHGGGDGKLMQDFIRMLRGGGGKRTRLEDSIDGHRIGFAAEISRTTGHWVTL